MHKVRALLYVLMIWNVAAIAETFTSISLPSGVGTLTCVSTDGLSVFAGTTQGVARYDTDTKTWTVGKKPITDHDIKAIAAGPQNCMAITSTGAMFFSPNRGTDWFQVWAIPQIQVATCAAFYNGLYVIGTANGVFTVDAMQQQIIKMCEQLATGNTLHVTVHDNSVLMVQDGQQGLQVLLNDEKKCSDITNAGGFSLDPIQGAFYN